MGDPQSRPCEPWATDFDCAVNAVSDGQIDAALLQATSIVYALSGRRYGRCTETVRPCKEPSRQRRSPLPGRFSWPDDNGDPCGIHDSCSCTAGSRIRLWRHPVIEATVKIDGAVLDPSLYTLVDWQWLYRTDGETWPDCQDMLAADTEPGTWSITYRWGRLPPPLGVRAVQALACELLKDDLGLECDLPKRVTQVTRQGLSFTMSDSTELLKDGLLGLDAVDRFVLTCNPHRQRQRPAILRADEPRRKARRV